MLLDAAAQPDLSGHSDETLIDKLMQGEYTVSRYDAVADTPLNDESRQLP